jgi:crossover junction endodeoxyribonuclease RuvC
VRILGIDPGSRVTGYGLVEIRGADLGVLSHGRLRPGSGLAFGERLAEIADAVGGLVDAYGPDEAAIEDLFHAVNPRSALQLAHLRGAVIAELARRGLRLFAYAPRAVKKAVTGSGAAGKHQVRFMVERLLGVRLSGEGDDVSDALAVAICHAHARGRAG